MYWLQKLLPCVGNQVDDAPLKGLPNFAFMSTDEARFRTLFNEIGRLREQMSNQSDENFCFYVENLNSSESYRDFVETNGVFVYRECQDLDDELDRVTRIFGKELFRFGPTRSSSSSKRTTWLSFNKFKQENAGFFSRYSNTMADPFGNSDIYTTYNGRKNVLQFTERGARLFAAWQTLSDNNFFNDGIPFVFPVTPNPLSEYDTFPHDE